MTAATALIQIEDEGVVSIEQTTGQTSRFGFEGL